ncbi:hypothetical protein GALMADRAFT_161222 [Galerina marginata CBS 339.88]|uniref:Uncharacterized protein n=1 Tax=Galerina marginata (strain CBS 339.88) TaxID=685588 RepID=A0A067SDS3_GALM3|nr:hypothetical protein GALMADRAFT_161222 [Galerina marginata CBS 339.88]
MLTELTYDMTDFNHTTNTVRLYVFNLELGSLAHGAVSLADARLPVLPALPALRVQACATSAWRCPLNNREDFKRTFRSALSLSILVRDNRANTVGWAALAVRDNLRVVEYGACGHGVFLMDTFFSFRSDIPLDLSHLCTLTLSNSLQFEFVLHLALAAERAMTPTRFLVCPTQHCQRECRPGYGHKNELPYLIGWTETVGSSPKNAQRDTLAWYGAWWMKD